MKKYIYIPFVIVSLLLLAAGCRQSEFEEPSAVSHTLTGLLERGAETKTHFGDPIDDVYYPYWTEDDALAVYADGLPNVDKYVLTVGAGTEKGSFEGRVAGTRYVALYPYEDNVPEGLKGNVLHFVLPAEQSYQAGSIGEGAFPMLAVGDDRGLSFKNLCSVLKVSVTGDAGVQAVHFVARDENMSVSGPASVRTDFGKLPELVMSEGGSPRVTVRCPGILLDEETPTDFFIVIPSGTYRGGFSVEIETFSGIFTREVYSDITFGRSQFRYIKPFRCDAEGEIDPDDIPYNQIWYETISGEVYNPPAGVFDRNILSNTYEDGKGIIVFDEPLTRVGEGAFSYAGIRVINLPNTVEYIGDNAFTRSNIISFHTPDHLKSVGSEAFSSCRNLERIYGIHATQDEKGLVLDGSLVAYAYKAIDGVVVIQEGVTDIVEFLFYNQDAVKEVFLPEGFRSLGDYAFSSCKNLETVYLPDSVEEIGGTTFYKCPSLREFTGTNSLVIDKHAIVDYRGFLMAYAGAGIADYVIPEGVINIQGSFAQCPSLHSLTFPESLEYTNSPPFTGSDNLEFFYGAHTTGDHHCLVLDDELKGVTPILPKVYAVPSGYGIKSLFCSFSRNKTVERLTIPDEITSIYTQSFANMPQLRSLRLPAGLSVLEDAFNGTANLDTLYVRSYAPPIFTEFESAYFGHDGLVICVPKGMEEQYKVAPTWSKYAQYIQGYVYDDLPAPDYYMSTDYSRDGKVTQMQKAKKGNGIDIVMMGDAFSDREIADGTYRSVMDSMLEGFFSEEPYTTYRDLFNVYCVDVVSATEGYDHLGQALGGWFGEGTNVGGSDARCIEYALRAVSEERMDNTLIIVAMNSTKYAGTCWMHDSTSGVKDYGCGVAVCYFPVGSADGQVERLVHHEAGGHGFAKLADEYAYEYMGTMPQELIEYRSSRVPLGWWKNADFTGDPEKVKWARFLADDRYKYDGLGCFEGAFTYWKGAWRPTDTSIMRYNIGGFNAPSREAIWYRMHKLAYGASWQYDYEEFVAYDAVNRKTAASASAPRRYAPERPFTPTAPPVITGTTWREEVEAHRSQRQK